MNLSHKGKNQKTNNSRFLISVCSICNCIYCSLATASNLQFRAFKRLRPSDVRAFASLHDEIQQVRRWKTNLKSKSKLLARIILTSSNERTFESCMKSGDNKELGDINKAFAILHRAHPSGIPVNWRSLSNSQLASQIEETLEVEQGNEVRKRISLLLAKESSKIVIERWGLEKFPSAQRPDHQDRWITALDSAIEKDVAPIAEWYDTILKVDALTYVGNDSSGLDVTILFRPKWNNVVFQGKNTVANFDVLLRFRQI